MTKRNRETCLKGREEGARKKEVPCCDFFLFPAFLPSPYGEVCAVDLEIRKAVTTGATFYRCLLSLPLVSKITPWRHIGLGDFRIGIPDVF